MSASFRIDMQQGIIIIYFDNSVDINYDNFLYAVVLWIFRYLFTQR